MTPKHRLPHLYVLLATLTELPPSPDPRGVQEGRGEVGHDPTGSLSQRCTGASQSQPFFILLFSHSYTGHTRPKGPGQTDTLESLQQTIGTSETFTDSEYGPQTNPHHP